MEESSSLWTLHNVGNTSFKTVDFGDSVLIASTITGKDRPALDQVKMAALYGVVKKKTLQVHIRS